MNLQFKIALALLAGAAFGFVIVFSRARRLSPNGAHPATVIVTNVSAVMALVGIGFAFAAATAHD